MPPCPSVASCEGGSSALQALYPAHPINYATPMRHEVLSSPEQRLAEKYLEQFGTKTKRYLKSRWPYKVEEVHFDSAIHDAAIQLARQTSPQEPGQYSTFCLLANRRLIDILRQTKLLNDKRNYNMPAIHQLDDELAPVFALEAADFVEEILKSDLAKEIIDFLQQERARGERWANIFYLYYIEGLGYPEMEAKYGYGPNAVSDALLRTGPEKLKKRFATSI